MCFDRNMSRCMFDLTNVTEDEDIPRYIFVETHLWIFFYKCIVYFQVFERFSRYLKKVFHVQIFLPTRFVKISINLKNFQRYRQVCSAISLSSFIKIRLTLTPKS